MSCKMMKRRRHRRGAEAKVQQKNGRLVTLRSILCYMDLAFQLATVCRPKPIPKINCSQKISTFLFNLLINSTSVRLDIGHYKIKVTVAI